MPATKVERFAYPVLLERARAAELAQKAHPVRPDGPALETLHEIVTAAFAERGHTIEQAEWDAWKDEKGFWVAQLQWRHGHSEIAAHWRYQPDAHGGSVSPLDDPANDLIDPDFGRALRGLATILPTPAEQAAPVVEAPKPVEPRPREPVAAPTARPTSRPAAQPTLDEYFEQRAVAAGGGAAAIPAAPVPTAPIPAVPAAPAPQPAAQAEKEPVAKEPAADKPAAKPARTKRGKAPMPSWEDVLLGVRSSGH